jgi:hypothetical protein
MNRVKSKGRETWRNAKALEQTNSGDTVGEERKKLRNTEL